ncbi:hypothetical protein B0H63DRAFT_155372 [Podospora didyma]|uniref:NACHT domain-containing protein n=1 Tax=Podospora didyma TaxID=330526 RepID=A0AAE0U187_9PEZI|nr:hypothetical protein B0H63DRAFT_155372 [Podospora didyma]
MESDSLSKKREDVLSWLSTLDHSQRYHAIRSLRVEGTGKWLLNHSNYPSWRDDKASPNILWCHGIQGAGKTFLASTIIYDLQSSVTRKASRMGFFYFEHQNQSTQSPDQVFANLIRQILANPTYISQDIANTFEKMKQSSQKIPLRTEDVLQLLLGSLRELGSVFIVMDALDECENSDHLGKILAFIQKAREIENTRVLVTSRPYPLIKEAFDDSPNITIQADGSDIRGYVQHSLRNCELNDDIDDSLNDKINTAILNSANGIGTIARPL